MKATAIDFSRMISLNLANIDDKEWVDPTLIPTKPLETALPVFPLPITKTKSSSAKSRKRKEAHAHVPFPLSVAEGTPEDRPGRVTQMRTVRGRDGGRTQSKGVKGAITPEARLAETDDLDGDDF